MLIIHSSRNSLVISQFVFDVRIKSIELPSVVVGDEAPGIGAMMSCEPI
jgi:hypothetical protein